MEILYGLAIIALTAVLIVKEVLSYKKDIAMAKVNKAKDVQEINYLFPENEKQSGTIDEGDSNLVGLDSIVEVLEEE